MTRGRPQVAPQRRGCGRCSCEPFARLSALKRVKACAPSLVRKSVQALHATVGQVDGGDTRAFTEPAHFIVGADDPLPPR